MSKKKWFNLRSVQNAKNEITAEIDILDPIDSWGGVWGCSAKDLRNELKELGDDVKNIKVIINSPGGEVLEGLAIFNMLVSHSASVSVEIIGIAASIASVIAMCADEGKINIADNAYIMIHNPWSMACGDSDDMRKQADIMDSMRDGLISAYQRHSSKTKDELIEMMDDTTWLRGDEAIEAGLASSTFNAPKVAAFFDLKNLANAPNDLIISYNQKKEENEMGGKKIKNEEPTEPQEPKATDTDNPVAEPAEPATEPAEPATEPAEPATEPAEPATEPAEPATEPNKDEKDDAKALFCKIKAKFGIDIAAQCLEGDKTMDDAKDLYIAKLENDAQTAKDKKSDGVNALTGGDDDTSTPEEKAITEKIEEYKNLGYSTAKAKMIIKNNKQFKK